MKYLPALRFFRKAENRFLKTRQTTSPNESIKLSAPLESNSISTKTNKRKFSLSNSLGPLTETSVEQEEMNPMTVVQNMLDATVVLAVPIVKQRNSLLSVRKLPGHRTEMVDKYKTLPLATMVPASYSQRQIQHNSTSQTKRKPLDNVTSSHHNSSNRLDFESKDRNQIIFLKSSKSQLSTGDSNVNKGSKSSTGADASVHQSRGHKVMKTNVIQDTPVHKLPQTFNKNIKLMQNFVFGLKPTDNLFDE